MELLKSDGIKALLNQNLFFGETLLYLLIWKNETEDPHDRLEILGSSKLHFCARQGGPSEEQFKAWFRGAAKGKTRLTQMPGLLAGDSNFAPTISRLGAIYPDFREELPSNVSTIKARLEEPRTDVDDWTENEVQKIKAQEIRESLINAVNEDTAKTQFDKLLGSSDSFISARSLDMSNLRDLSRLIQSQCKPDLCDGIRRADLSMEIEEQLGDYIVPHQAASSPCLPTWFMEIKGPTGNLRKAKDQAIRAGVLGERGVYKLRLRVDASNAGDRKAHVITSVFSSNEPALYVYCMHRAFNGRYMMTELKQVAIDSPDTLKKAAVVLRNGREWAREVREMFLKPMLTTSLLDGDTGSGEQLCQEEQPRGGDERSNPQHLLNEEQEIIDEERELETPPRPAKKKPGLPVVDD